MNTEHIKIDKLVHGGQGMGTLADGRKVFAWNALPGETVVIEIRKNKKDFAEGVAVEIVAASPERIEPLEPNFFMATSPWQILDYNAENKYKKSIIAEAFEREHVIIPSFKFISLPINSGYRNKMEYSFYGDELGLHLALYGRGTHRKHIVSGSALALPVIDLAANQILTFLDGQKVQARQLKSLMIRCTKRGEVVAALFVKDENIIDLSLALGELQGIAVYYSNPKSPASIITRGLQSHGDLLLKDELLGEAFRYEAHSFFQVNLPIFEMTLQEIKNQAKNDLKVVDMYSGVGSIGLSLKAKYLTLVEIDKSNAALAATNAKSRAEVVQTSSEGALQLITSSSTIIVDPPRAGLHQAVSARIQEVSPPKIIYLSCNPATQARDIAILADKYNISFFEGYNYFPRTPHIETLAVLTRK